MTTTAPQQVLAADLLAPVTATLKAMYGAEPPSNLVPDLVVLDDSGWRLASRLIDGSLLADLLDWARRRWQASVHAAAALAWKSYCYCVAMPAVLGWAAARRVPLLRPADVLIRFDDRRRSLAIGLRRSVAVAVLPSDPLARCGFPQVRVVRDDDQLLVTLRESLLDGHLTPVLDAIHARARVGARTLRGSISSGIAHGMLRAAGVLPGLTAADINTLLWTLGVQDLVELVPGPAGDLTVRRKTCCLAFTLPKRKVCASCCIKA